MIYYPVHYRIERPSRFSRLQLAVRVVAFIGLGVLGLSFGTIFLAAYLLLPVLAAVRLGGNRPREAFIAEDGPTIVAGLRWFAAVCAWFGLTADQLPARAPEETVRIEIDHTGHPAPATALWRVLLGLPSALVLAVLGVVGSFVWLWAALTVLVSERVGDGAFHYLAGVQRWCVRLLAYQASLVDEYPPFSFDDAPPAFPAARAVG